MFMNNSKPYNHDVNRSTFFSHLENRESEFDISDGNKGQFEIAKTRMLEKVDLIAAKLPTNKIFNNFQRSFKATEQDFDIVIEVDGGKYSISEILTHIERRLSRGDEFELKPSIETWINALPKVIY
jgi:hypothetical protein